MTRYATPFLLLATTVLAQQQGKYADPELTANDRAHWAFKPPVRPAVPAVRNAPWVRTPVDAFVLAKLDAAGLKPLPEADKLTLVRRVTLDLTGLPPTPAEVEAFLKDASPTAYETVVERLLASPHFGERQASHWLDVVRFAESNGFELDADRPHAWRYRDYVVKSFNDDKPYDRFITEQIAGDEMAAGKNPREVAELLVATGLHRCGQVHQVSGNLDTAVLRQEVLTEMVNGVGSAVLGLTVGCARCHDHKFDAISAGDYYRLQAFFANTKYDDVSFATADEKAARKTAADAVAAKAAPIKKQIADIDAPYRASVGKAKREKLDAKTRAAFDTPADKRTAEQKKLVSDAGPLVKVSWEDVLAALPPADREKRAALREQLHALEAREPPPTAAAWAIKAGDPAKTFVLRRGDVHRKTIEVTPNFPRVLVSGTTEPKSRLELAKWLTRPEHPLTARVVVNRIWQSHFGRGIVASANDFGVKGEKPTHPELLDWLAAELVKPEKPQAAWGMKHIHRLIVTSATYRQAITLQPANKLLAGMNRRRLEAEAIRDSVLTAAGTLNRKVGGPSVKVPLEPEVYDLIFTEGEPDGLWPVTPDATQHVRRSIYLFNKRNVRLPMLEAFDQPDTLNSCAVRPVSTFAPQALILMNGPFVHEQAKALALKLVHEGGNPIEELYRRAFGRVPTNAERRLALVFLKEQEETIRDRVKARLPIGVTADGVDVVRVRALADLCAVVFNTNEFVHIP